jgi:hypothetical protein
MDINSSPEENVYRLLTLKYHRNKTVGRHRNN